jgi:hypothetical protein
MVGAARRLATELVVIIASAIHEIHCVLAARPRAAATAPDPEAGAWVEPVLEVTSPDICASCGSMVI